MSYRPTLKSIGIDEPTQEGYRPTLSSIGMQDQPKKSFSIIPKPMNAEDEKRYRRQQQKYLLEAAAGGAQGIANIPSGTAEILNPTSHKVPRFNFAPDTEASRIGQMIAPFAGPAGVEAAAMKGLSLAPKALNALQKITSSMKSKPVLNALSKAGKTGAELGYINALENPEHAKEEFLKGGALGAGIGALAPAVGSAIPLVGPLAKAGIGGLIGAQFGHPFAGALTAAGLPVRSLLGIESKNKIAGDMLSGLEPKDVMKSINANRRLGTNATPGEASGNYPLAGKEGALKRTAGGGQLGYRLEELEKNKQTNTINSMLDKIFKPTKENLNNINQLYKQANRYNLKPGVVESLKDNSVMEHAFNSVKSNHVFRNVPENNYEFLAEVDRTLQRMYEGERINSPSSAYVIQENKKVFNKFLKDNNKMYAKATEAAQPKIVREKLESKLNKENEDLTAKTFFSRLLNSRRSYRELLHDTKNFPEAQRMIKDMRVGWKNMANLKTTSQSEAQAKTALDHARNIANFIMTTLKNSAGARGDIKRLKFIYSPEWEKKFADLAKIQDKQQRLKEMTHYVLKSGAKAGIGADKMQNIMNPIMDEKE